VTKLDINVWQHMHNLNVRSAFLAPQHAARLMVQHGYGRIINTSSRATRSGRKRESAYAAPKAGVTMLTEALGGANIKVNCIPPSIIDTPANRAEMPRANFARLPNFEEIARVLLFLASVDAQFINRSAIPVYGLD
jgi:NAD(P)-dependent dehydrogenase (short-subunit alcohol dehydrogenase family)